MIDPNEYNKIFNDPTFQSDLWTGADEWLPEDYDVIPFDDDEH